MDKTFIPAGIAKPQPPEGKFIEVWHGNSIIKGRKVSGHWEIENGTIINVEGWRLPEEPAKPDKAKRSAAAKSKAPPRRKASRPRKKK
jgi:hypothetical protein